MQTTLSFTICAEQDEAGGAGGTFEDPETRCVRSPNVLLPTGWLST